ncbi:hypothetical protein, conserved [Eimeria maxima]|uniref:Uncharacterized protein n=1 Tax=Eimeria maxima TaxID=5804 RepID=U6M8U0_EIMMA|nr:hypothetical protein, conserved [Eimeria maxima]CDJ60451.1 hypothetical protein, conserved [Eimeria maxima]
MVWSVCVSIHSRERGAVAVGRRLAGRGKGIDENEQSVLDECLDLQEDMGVSLPGAALPSNRSRSRRIAELVTLFSEAAAELESTQGPQSTCCGTSSSPTSTPPTQGQPSESGLNEQGLLECEEGGIVPVHGSSSSVSSEGDGDDGKYPYLEPDAWLEKIPDITGMQEHREQGQSLWGLGGGYSGGEEPSTAALAVRPCDEGGDDSPSSNATRTHPFVRLPVLEDGVLLRDFDVSAVALAHRRKYQPTTTILAALRELYMRPALDQSGYNTLMRSLEELVHSLLVRVRSRALFADTMWDLPTLGIHFLAFDFLVSAAQVLGNRMQLHLWWDRFVAAFALDMPPKPFRKHSRHCAAVQAILRQRLFAALQVYKMGRRLPLGDVVELKRLLLCSPYTHKRFKDDDWDPWRDDEELFLTSGLRRS